jgi:hypothetical protein
VFAGPVAHIGSLADVEQTLQAHRSCTGVVGARIDARALFA